MIEKFAPIRGAYQDTVTKEAKNLRPVSQEK